jgi:hypothetical protein
LSIHEQKVCKVKKSSLSQRLKYVSGWKENNLILNIYIVNKKWAFNVQLYVYIVDNC